MLLNSTPSTEVLRYTAPGKVFLLGEYAVLAGLPALVASVGPRFQLSVLGIEQASPRPFHPQSPASRLLDWADSMRATGLSFSFEDSGKGGFGASTAQFALAYCALAETENWEKDWARVWKLYRELTPSKSGISPSGADLIAQWAGGVVLFDPSVMLVESLWDSFDWNSILVFSASGQAGRKVATHEHLAALDEPQTLEILAHYLAAPLRDGIAAIRAGSPARLGQAMREYAECLRQAGLEIRATLDDLVALQGLPGVLGAKGAGALQADSIVLVMDPQAGAAARDTVIRVALDRGLALVADGLERQSGVTCLN